MKSYKKMITIFGYLALLGMLVYLLMKWNQIPDQIPAHYNFAGEIDRYDSKTSILIVPVLTVFLFAMLTTIVHIPSMWNMPYKVSESEKERIQIAIQNMLLTMRCFITMMFTYMMMCSMNGESLSAKFSIILISGNALCVIITMIYTFKINKKEKNL